jgi:hypothetical protein
MDDATVFLLIFIIIILLFMQFYFVSYRKDAFILRQIELQNTRFTAIETRLDALETDSPTTP